MAYKSLMMNGTADSFLDMIIKQKNTFDLYLSNYTMKVVKGDVIFNFTKNEQSKRCFSAFTKLKSELSERVPPNIQATDVSYFVHDFKEPVYVEKVCNIDLKSAYATILMNDGYISKDLFKYLSKLPKKDRLSSVGMLASKKDIFEFKGGVTNSKTTARSEFSPFFFYAVKRTFEIMSELKKILGPDYLFTWVDGIYFLPNADKIYEVEAYLRSIKFPFSKDMLSEFDVRFTERSIMLTFKKDGKLKPFHLPHPEDGFKRAISERFQQVNNKFRSNNSQSLKSKQIK